MDDQRIEEIARRHAERVETYVLGDYIAEEGEWGLGGIQSSVAKAIREALSSQEEEIAFMQEAVEEACKDRDYYEQKETEAREELRTVREQRDALKAQLRGVGIVPYLDRMKELAAARDEALALMKRDQPDMYRAMLADQAKQDALKARAEPAEAELQRMREGMRNENPQVE